MKKLILFILTVFMLIGSVSAITCSDVDFNGDGVVNGFDLLEVRQCYNLSASSIGTDGEICLEVDIDDDGFIGNFELDAVRDFYLQQCEVENSCKEYGDSGYDYYTKGRVEQYVNGKLTTYEEKCTSSYKLQEYKCDPNGVTLLGYEYTCPLGCEDGACVGSISCTDTDSGLDYYNKGEVKNNLNQGGNDCCTNSYSGTCVSEGAYINEKFCTSLNPNIGYKTGGGISYMIYKCANGCVDGKCVSEDTGRCVDSDSGYDYYNKGQLSWAGENWGNYIDYCSGSVLYEARCNGVTKDNYFQGKNLWTAYTCPNGCSNGACIKEAARTCSDSDGGKEFYEKGVTKLNDSTFQNVDSCYGNRLTEYYCNDQGGTSAYYHVCEYGCEDGACSTTPAPQVECSDSDGLNYYVKGLTKSQEYPNGIYDSCASYSEVYEHYCANGIFQVSRYSCPSGRCIAGACVSETTTCTDTDNGLDYYTKGDTSSQLGGTTHDACESQTTLIEGYCSGGQVKTVAKECPYRCSDGACVKTTCSDSDGSDTVGAYDSGSDIYTSGKVTYGNHIFSGSSSGVLYDNCYDSTQLREYRCHDKEGIMIEDMNVVKCENGCLNGACVKLSTTPPFSCDVSDTLQVGQTKKYTVDGKTYEVTVMVVSKGASTDVAKLIINDEVTASLSKGSTYTLKDGLRLFLKSVHVRQDSYGYNLAEFCLNGDKVVPEKKCTDSDGGKNYYQKGSATGIYGACYDSCIRQLSGEYWIQECYCDPKGPWSASIVTACPAGSTCQGGRCEGEELGMDKCLDDPNNYWDQYSNKCYPGYTEHVAKQLCTDPDGGKVAEKRAHTYGFRKSYANSRDKRIRTGGQDGCIGNNLREYYCSSEGYITSVDMQCLGGCQDGACVGAEQAYCVAETSGHRLNLGVLNGKNRMSKEDCYDFANSIEKVKEYICRNEKGKELAKIKWNGIQLYTVNAQCQSDGVDLELKSLSKADFHEYEFSINVCVHGDKSINDLKKENPNIKGFPYEQVIYTKYGEKVEFSYDAGGWIEEIKNGDCTNLSFTVEDNHQDTFDNYGKIEINLDPDDLIKETNEYNNRLIYFKRNTSQPDNGNCKETDNSFDYYNKGKITLTRPDGNVFRYEDVCLGNKLLNEYSCADATIGNTICSEGCNLDQTYECPYGCKNGRCIENNAEGSCTFNYGVACLDASVEGEQVVLTIRNDLGYDIAITELTTEPEGKVFLKNGGDLGNGEKKDVIITGLKENGNINLDIVLRYRNKETGLVHKITGEALIKRAEKDECSADLDCAQVLCEACVSDDPDCYCPATRCVDGECTLCRKECMYDGTSEEGWYDSCTKELIRHDKCDAPTCFDGIWNDGETGVDCGGPCEPCDAKVECETGCSRNGKCLPYGTRIVEDGTGLFCNLEGDFQKQRAEKDECQNDYECQTNMCSSGKCIDIGKKLDVQQEILKKIVDWISRWFR